MMNASGRIAYAFTGPKFRATFAYALFPEGGRVRTGYAIGQNMYTPPDITVPDPPPNTHPYAVWLHGCDC